MKHRILSIFLSFFCMCFLTFGCSSEPIDPCQGVTCNAGETCKAGICGLNCAGGTTACGTKCVDLQTSKTNCGTCGTACKTGEDCVSGTCKITCQAGFTVCNDTCVNLQSDSENCGKCGEKCQAGSVCSKGTCKTTCASNETTCSGNCVNLQTDTKNCGSCGKACKTGQGCCGGKCVDLQTNNDNCGSCGVRCSSSQSCCAGRCTDLAKDAKNCGVCGNICDANESCEKKVCGDGAGATCKSDTDCKTGHRCLSVIFTEKKFCFQVCNKGKNDCANNKDGRTFCFLIRTDSGICMKPAKKGEACTQNTTIQAFCDGYEKLAYCNRKGVCDEKIVSTREGEKCNKQSMFDVPPAPQYICDKSLGLYCDQKTEKCSFADEHEHCDVGASPQEPGNKIIRLGTQVSCKPNKNLSCHNYWSRSNSIQWSNCVRNCTRNSECKSGHVCQNGTCIYTCSNDSDCENEILPGWRCSKVKSGGVITQKCFPPPPSKTYYP